MKKFIIIGFIVALAAASVLLWQHFKHPSDASIRRQLVGTWMPTSSNTVTVRSDGSYKDVHTNGTIEGTWRVDGGVWTLTITNISGTFAGVRVGQVSSFEVVQISKHELAGHLIGGPAHLLTAKRP